MTQKLISFLILTMTIASQAIGQCGMAGTVSIPDLGTQYGYVRIENATIDDLGSAG